MSKFLPDVYTIRGLRAAQGLIFKDVFSAQRWLKEKGLELKDHWSIEPAEVIYYGSNLTSDMKTTEDAQKALDRISP